ncbi:Endonuclease, Uma2 family (restriction endonuclease fold) [Streptomyces sp. WMMB 714]|jgi:Uma2 family endonuclease|uniref:Uma2 family endonuclease n=1 Tax=Streptomyces sp. WMMB 714 TaxID=1286822 RepID=UPI0005F88B88|nr:Uma2 family endonuclease [Streptomyces sp. WMMB 714]SCK15107.1 Endonuclease, Uma2 family (restriction endonuclease fold) [Streptomyces sp. WMMB 714]
MSALTVDHGPADGRDWDDLVRIWDRTDGPEGSRVEIIEGIVTVSPPPANNHNSIADLVQRRLYTVIPEDWGIYQTLGVAVPSRSGLYIPDLVVAPRAVLSEPGNYIPAAAAELIVEITSPSNAGHDRISKPAGYAQAGVPLYLLVDGHAPAGPTVTVYGEPTGDVYRVHTAVKAGEDVRLPAPFELTLETADFPLD